MKDFNIRLLYFKYKDTQIFSFLVIALLFLVSLILFFQLILPQVESWFSIRNEIDQTNQRIATINSNMKLIDSMDKTQLDDQVKLASNALPFEKDFESIISALTSASLNAGVSLQDYSFVVGNIASVSAEPAKLSKDLSSVKLTVSITGNVGGVNNFLSEINKKLPLAEIIDVDGTGAFTTIDLFFYQKQFPQITFDDSQAYAPISNKESKMLDDFTSWQPPSDSGGSSDASGSGVPLF